MKLGWLTPLLSAAVIFAFPVASAQDEDIDKRLAAATERLAAELAAKSGLELPPLPAELAKQKPPEIIRQAGDDYVKAWQTYRTVTLRRPLPQKPPAEPKPEKSVNTSEEAAKEFKDLLKRTIEGLIAPDPADFEGFTYESDGDCATAIMGFWSTHTSAEALAMLRKGEYFPALQILAERRYSPALDSLLRAYGVDPDEFIVGAWLNRKVTQYDFPPSSGDKVAKMLLKWVELRWKASGRDSAISWKKNGEEPYYPLEGFMDFLEEDSRASEDTKRKMAAFLENQGCNLHPPEYWLERTVKGTGKSLETLFRKTLTSEYNWAKVRSSKLLTEAGIDHPKPTLTADPHFRITVNGKPWPGVLDRGQGRQEPYIAIQHSGTTSSSRLSLAGDGSFSCDADFFVNVSPKARIEIRDGPSSYSGPAHPMGAWLRADVSLPIRFGEVTNVDIELFEIDIEAKLPEDRKVPARLVEIEFGRVDEGRPAEGCCYHLPDSTRLALPYVSPGDYWLRVRHPGIALMPWQKVKVSKDGQVISPELKPGSTLVVPVAWPEVEAGKDKIPAEARSLLRRHGRNGFMELVELRKDGKKFTAFGNPPATAVDKFSASAIFANLPPGTYEIIYRGATPLAAGPDTKSESPAPSVEVTIRANDGVYLLSDPLLVPYQTEARK